MPAKILLADKSITIQKVVEMLFSGREYELVCVSDGETALNEATRVVPDVVLADVDLPRLDGYSFAARFKAIPSFAQTPVILMISRDDVYESVKGTQAGIIDHIAKPFESQELIGKVKKALASAPPAARPAAPPPPAAKPKQETPSSIFDIISNAPSQEELKRSAAPAEEESLYEVEPVVEEVEAPLTHGLEQALPVGTKAVEEIRAGLGLTEKPEEPQPEIVTFESLDMVEDTEQKAAPRVVEKHTPAATTKEPPSGRPQTLPPEELQSMVEKTITKMADDFFKNMRPPSSSKLSDETIRQEIEESVTKVARAISRDVIERVAWEVIPQLAEQMIKEEIERLKAEK